MMPKRIQRKRTKGWRMPEGAIYVGRPTKWGNPFDWQDYYDVFCSESDAKAQAAEYYRKWLAGEIKVWSLARQWILDNIEQIRGYDLACYCKPDQPCHADVLLELANS